MNWPDFIKDYIPEIEGESFTLILAGLEIEKESNQIMKRSIVNKILKDINKVIKLSNYQANSITTLNHDEFTSCTFINIKYINSDETFDNLGLYKKKKLKVMD